MHRAARLDCQTRTSSSARTGTGRTRSRPLERSSRSGRRGAPYRFVYKLRNYSYRIPCDRTRFLTSERRQAEEFEAIEVVVEVMRCLEEIKAVVALADLGRLAGAVGVLDGLRVRVDVTEGTPTLVKMAVDGEGNLQTIQLLSIPPYELPPQGPSD